MDLEGIMQSKIRQTEGDKYGMISFTCGTKNEQTHRYSEQLGSCQMQWAEGVGNG